MRHIGILALSLYTCDPGADPAAKKSSQDDTTQDPSPENTSSQSSSTSDMGTPSSTPEIWNPAPCPQGWVRPSEGQMEFRVLEVNGTEVPTTFDLHKTYANAHAYGNCIQVIDSKIAKVHLEFGPEIQGYPQSWLKLEIDQGETSYRVFKDSGPSVRSINLGTGTGLSPSSRRCSSVICSSGETILPPYQLTYTYVSEDPSKSQPQLQRWTAGAMGDGHQEHHQLSATWVSSMPGHNLEMRNKSFVHEVSAEGIFTTTLGLGFDLKLRLPGGPSVPDTQFCATLDRQKECNAFDCGSLVVLNSITDAVSCKTQPQPYCQRDEDTQEVTEPLREPLTFYDPKDPSRYVVVVHPILEGKDKATVPQGWKACKPGQLTPLACDCSCMNAGCRPKRLREELEQCGYPNDCPEVKQVSPQLKTKVWNDAQRCLIEGKRDRNRGQYAMDFELEDNGYDVRLFITNEGKVIVSTHEYWFSIPPNRSEDSAWKYPQICDLADPAYFTHCLDAPSIDCFVEEHYLFPAKALFSKCEPLKTIDCAL